MTFLDQNCWTEPAVTFDYFAWIARYPEFSGVSSDLAQLYFDEAELFCRNKLCPIRKPTTLLMFLNMLTAHVAWLSAPRDANGAPATTGTGPESGVVGQILSASEGAVSVNAKPIENPNAAWFAQSKYGFEFWQATAAFRTFRYFPRKTNVPSAIFPFIGQTWVR
jgi:Protein of unknown function (DUF4054)